MRILPGLWSKLDSGVDHLYLKVEFLVHLVELSKYRPRHRKCARFEWEVVSAEFFLGPGGVEFHRKPLLSLESVEQAVWNTV